MAYHPGLQLATVTVGGASTLESGDSLLLIATITATRSLLWVDGNTSWHYDSDTKTVDGVLGAELSFEILPCDISGFRTQNNQIIDVSIPGSYTHLYNIRVSKFKVSGTKRSPVGPPKDYSNVFIPTGDGSPIDLDTLLPVGTQAGGVVLVPDTWDARVAAAEAAAADMAAAAGIINDALTAEDSAVALLLADPDSATTAAMRAGAPHTTAFVPLSIPTSDGNPSTGHPSVVTHPSGATWNGYRYWMAHTPFPSDVRENPEICASNDGVNWVVPAGLVNPISTLQRAYDLGYDYWADTELTWSPDGTALWCYFKGTKTGVNNEYVRQTSTDGITWTPAALVVSHAERAGVSPAIVRNPTNYEMFDFRDGSMYRRTSTDGITWSARVMCSIPALPATYASWWHLSVVKRDGIYHALPVTSGGPNVQRHYYWTSTDGQTWTQANPAPAIALSGTRFDEGGHYRATFLPARSGMGGLWDVWLTCKDKSAGEIWRLGHLRDYDLAGGNGGWPFAPPPGIELSRASDELVVQARSAYTVSGSPLTTPMGPWGTIGLSKTVSGRVGVTFPPMPSDWQGYTIEALVVTDATASGDISLNAGVRAMFLESDIKWTTGATTPPVSTLAPNRPKWCRIMSASVTLIARPGAMLAVQIGRNGGNPADTLAGPLYFLAFRLRRLPLTGITSTYHI